MSTTATMAESTLPITQDLFAAMVDGEPGALVEGPVKDFALTGVPARAWVDIKAATTLRVLLTTEKHVADELARALLRLGASEPVSAGDLADALGEIANVIGGNLKGVLGESSTLTLPVVTTSWVEWDGELLFQQGMDWRGHSLAVALWELDEGEDR